MPLIDDDPILTRVAQANPAAEADFRGFQDFAALKRPRRKTIWFAAPVASASAIAFAVVAFAPNHSPGADEILEKAAAAVTPDTQILFAQSKVSAVEMDGTQEDYGVRKVWVRQGPEDPTAQMRWLQTEGPNTGSEDTSTPGKTARDPTSQAYNPQTNTLHTLKDATQIPGDVFRAQDLLDQAKQGKADVSMQETTLNGTPAYALTWHDNFGTTVTEDKTLWVDHETFAPLQYSDHDHGTDMHGKPFDRTLTEIVQDFQRLPDTATNRAQLEMSPHPGATRKNGF